MATTTNYGFEIPDDTDLVKDGALAMRDLGQDVDTTLATALGANDYAGLVLVKTQTVGTGVSSVTVTDAFSATYENYKIIYTGGTSAAADNLKLTLGATATGYNFALVYQSFTSTTFQFAQLNNGASWQFFGGANTTSGNTVDCELMAPFATRYTRMSGKYYRDDSYGTYGGTLNNGTSYTAFTIGTNSTTLTGGTIYVYGYGAS
jgi:hypothetical protein